VSADDAMPSAAQVQRPHVGSGPEGATDADAEAVTDADEGVARVDPGAAVNPGERITFAINASGMQFFDPNSGEAIWGA
jgi:hypothetical protein